jgi:hypothetical protein
MREDSEGRFECVEVGGSRGLRDRDKELGVVRVLMLVNTMVREERSDWGDIYGEQKRATYGALRHPRY